MNTSPKYKFNELCTLAGLTKRTVRYYVEHGMMDRPGGAKKGAYYTQKHLEQLLEIKKWQKAGLSLERIKSLLNEKDGVLPVPPPTPRQPGDVNVWSHIYISDGVELLIDPGRSGLSLEQISRISRALQEILTSDTLPQKD